MYDSSTLSLKQKSVTLEGWKLFVETLDCLIVLLLMPHCILRHLREDAKSGNGTAMSSLNKVS